MSKIDDKIRLRHVLDAAKEASFFIQRKTRKSLDTDRMLTLSLVKLIEIIGEAAAKISSEKQLEIRQITWAEIIGMRNRLIHAYFDVDLDIVWKTITEDIESLIAELEKVIIE